jgi:hypothetical protein
MPQMTMVQAITDALRVSLRDDPRVVVLGEDVGLNGGVFRVTEGCRRSSAPSACSIRRSPRTASSAARSAWRSTD